MKLQSNNLLEGLTRNELRILTTEVKETLVGNFKKEKKRIFSAAQYWDIQRRRKTLLARAPTSKTKTLLQKKQIKI